jgi:glycosyltransferase
MSELTIITTVFNAEDTIRACLESVRRQECSSIEHVIIDASSTDATLYILKEYKKASPYRVTIISEPDEGIYHGMNKGLRLASGDIVGILNADDLYPSDDVLSSVVHVFEEKGVDACYGDLVYFARRNPDENSSARKNGDGGGGNRVVRYWKSGSFDPDKFLWGWMPPHPTFFVRRSVYEKYGYFNPDLGSAADYEIMLRFLFKHRLKAVYIPQVLVHMRTGGASNATLLNRLKANRMDRKAWRVNGLRP